MQIDPQFTLDLILREAHAIDHAICSSPKLVPFFLQDFSATSKSELTNAYCQWLELTSQYVTYTKQMLRASVEILLQGNEQDQVWARHIGHYEDEETDQDHEVGHEQWAKDDILDLNPEYSFNDEKGGVNVYSDYFVANAQQHPYAVLGAKGVLENLSLINAGKFHVGLQESGIITGTSATRFIDSHGELDKDHVEEANRDLLTLEDPKKLVQVIIGAYVTSGSYRSFLSEIK